MLDRRPGRPDAYFVLTLTLNPNPNHEPNLNFDPKSEPSPNLIALADPCAEQGDSVDRKTLGAGCDAAAGGTVKPDAFLLSLDEECMQRRNNYSRWSLAMTPAGFSSAPHHLPCMRH